MRVIAFLEVPDYDDPQDVADSVHARLCDEAGYYGEDGDPITPTSTHVYVHADTGRPLAHAENRRPVEVVELPDAESDEAFVERVEEQGRITVS